MSSINIKTYDEFLIPINIDVIKYSETIQSMIDVIDSNETIIPLYNSMCTKSNILQIKYFLEYIHAYPIELEKLNEFNNTRGNTPISEWLTDYAKMTNDVLCEIVIVADYLNIKCLLELLCNTLANNIRAYSPEEIAQMFSQIN